MSPLRALRLGCCILAAAAWTFAARASDPLPGDLVTPPANVNIALIYNEYAFANQYDEADGTKLSDTRLAEDVVVARYIHTFSVGGFTAGVQGYASYVTFAGNQRLGIPGIPAPASGLPGFGAGREQLTSEDGFGQPNLGAFIYPVQLPASGTYAVISPWISPPIGNFDSGDSLRASKHAWTYELEGGVRTTLLGAPAGRNLSIEVWDTVYFFGHNDSDQVVSPEVDADAIPALYQSRVRCRRRSGSSPATRCGSICPISSSLPSAPSSHPGFTSPSAAR